MCKEEDRGLIVHTEARFSHQSVIPQEQLGAVYCRAECVHLLSSEGDQLVSDSSEAGAAAPPRVTWGPLKQELWHGAQ